MRVSKTSARTATKLLQLRPHGTAAVPALESHTQGELRNNIRRGTATTSGKELHRVNNSAFRRYVQCMRSGGQHFHYLLQPRWGFITRYKDYYHCDALSSSVHGPIPVPRRGIWLNARPSVRPPFRGQAGKERPCTILFYLENCDI
jgi:hypothetical protein